MGKGKAITGFIMGIVGNVFALYGSLVVTAWLSLPIAIVGLVLSVSAGKTYRLYGQHTGLPTAGLIIGIIAVVNASISFLVCGICIPLAAVIPLFESGGAAVAL